MRKLNFEKVQENIRTHVSTVIGKKVLPCASILVYQENGGFYREEFGCSDISGNKKLKNDAIFRLASMSKPITAVAAMILVDRGLLSLEDPISKYLPDFSKLFIGRIENDAVVEEIEVKTAVTIKELLTHSSGIGSGDIGAKDFLAIPVEERATLEMAMPHYAKCRLEFEPKTSSNYSPFLGLDILSRIIEIVSGKSYDIFLKEEIFDKLGMRDTTFVPTEEQWDRMVRFADEKDGKCISKPLDKTRVFEQFPLTFFAGSAGLASTMDDYFAFAKMLLNEGEYNGVRILNTDTVRAMATPQLTKEVLPPPQVWGLGVRVITDETYGTLVKNCYGWAGAYGTYFWVDPDNKIVAIYMRNVADSEQGYTASQFEQDVTSSLE